MANVNENQLYLGIEFGSTRIKAVAIDDNHNPVDEGNYLWKSGFENGIWTYPLEDVWKGIKAAISSLKSTDRIAAIGISGMMHGFLAFDKDWNLLVPFRTWQNTITGEAAEKLTEVFQFNIPQRWSIAHLYQAILNGEEYIREIAHITTLAGYVHRELTGENVVGIGEGSGMFPIDSTKKCFDETMLDQFDALIYDKGLPWKIRDLLPTVLLAGESAGTLTKKGSALLDHKLAAGIPLCPSEGDAGTGMTATNAVAPRTGNVSAGTSIFSMVVLERTLSKAYPELGMVTTPTGAPVAMVHCTNCTGDINAWFQLFRDVLATFGTQTDSGEFYTKLFNLSLEGEADCGGIVNCNYLSGESVTHFDAGRPMIIRKPETDFSLPNFVKALIYSSVTTLSIGMRILKEEGVQIDSLTGHGGLFKTPGVGQGYLAAACGVPVTCMKTAGEGGPYGMALLAAYMTQKEEGESLEAYLEKKVFRGTEATVVQPDETCSKGFAEYAQRFETCLGAEKVVVRDF